MKPSNCIGIVLLEILLIFGGVILAVFFRPEWILISFVAPFGIFLAIYLGHKRNINRLKGSIIPGEVLVAEGYVGQDSAILIRGGKQAYRLLVGIQKVNLAVKEALGKTNGAEGSVGIEMETSHGVTHFLPRKAFLKYGQREYAEKILGELMPISASSIRPGKSYTVTNYMDIAENIQQKIYKQGEANLSYAEKVFHTIHSLNGLIVKGGFLLFFRTPTTDFFLDPEDALKEINAYRIAAVVKKAKALIPGKIHADEKGIKKWLKTLDEATLEKLEGLEEEFCEGNDLLCDLLVDYMRTNEEAAFGVAGENDGSRSL